MLLLYVILQTVSLSGNTAVFSFVSKDAGTVYVAGSFNNWKKDDPDWKMKKEDNGKWILKHVLKPGRYSYKFVVDGSKWLQDKDNPLFEDDGYGGKNSVLMVGTKNARPPYFSNGKVIFSYFDASAYAVYLSGTFNNWAPDGVRMKNKDGLWTCGIKLTPGYYQYKFVVNGKDWKLDPSNPARVPDGYGGYNSSIKLLESGKVEYSSPQGAEQGSKTPVIKKLKAHGTPLYLAIVWHQHQPRYYRNLKTGEYFAPWVRLHGIKDYFDMAHTVSKYNNVHVTINLTPVLLMQLENEIKMYEEGRSPDICVRMTLKNADSLSFKDKKYLLENFFSANWDNMIDIWPRYRELRQKRVTNQNGSINIEATCKKYSTADFRDLQMWFNLAWFDPDFQDTSVMLPNGERVTVKNYIKQGRNFTEKQKKEVMDLEFKILKAIIPEHKRLAKSGQIEVITTPYFHPILPLLYDTNLASEAMPGTPLPNRFHHPEDAMWQLNKAVWKYKSIFGVKPYGMWPAEGSVAQAIVPLVHRAGFTWMASDVGVLSHSLNKGLLTSDDMYRPYTVGDDSDRVYMVFRDTDLSDRIGFRYRSLSGMDAANDFIKTLYNIQQKFVNDKTPHLVTVILDGENAWEWYKRDGKDFFRALYSQLNEKSGWLVTTTVKDFLQKYPPERRIKHLFAGSWINADFSTWIGEPEENMAWDYLGRVRNFYGSAVKSGKYKQEALQKAFLELASAEGSDWFWFFGNDQNAPGGDKWTDIMFRKTLKNVYTILGITPPAFLDSSIIKNASSYVSAGGGIMAQSSIQLAGAKKICAIIDPIKDDYGDGNYMYPSNNVFKKGILDLSKVEIYKSAKGNYIFKLYFKSIGNPWNAPLGFSFKSIQVYISGQGKKVPFFRNLGVQFDRQVADAIVVTGWPEHNGIFDIQGKEIGQVRVSVDKKENAILFTAPSNILKNIEGKYLYVIISSYDGYGTNQMRKVVSFASGKGEWVFSGGGDKAPLAIDILDPDGTQKQQLSLWRKGKTPVIKGVFIK